MKHTPGPWHIWENDPKISNSKDYHARISGKDGFCLAIAYGQTYEEAEANALLIAAAPDLLEACKAAMLWIDETFDPIDFPTETVIKLEQAIKKAE